MASRREFLGSTLLAAQAARAQTPAGGPPNILYIHSHDSGRYLSPYGYAVPTPNLKKLASEGVLFRQAFSGAPTCSPSRACLLSGQYAHQVGMTGLVNRGWSMTDYSRHMLHTLRTGG
jgi:N-sulfoglucosamine sulfohydrolase